MPSGGEQAKLGFLSSQHVGFTEGPKPGKPLGGVPMEWIFPVTDLRGWLESERKRLRQAKGEKQPEKKAETPAEPSRDNALEMLLGNVPVVDEVVVEEKKEEEPKPRIPAKKGKRKGRKEGGEAKGRPPKFECRKGIRRAAAPYRPCPRTRIHDVGRGLPNPIVRAGLEPQAEPNHSGQRRKRWVGKRKNVA